MNFCGQYRSRSAHPVQSDLESTQFDKEISRNSTILVFYYWLISLFHLFVSFSTGLRNRLLSNYSTSVTLIAYKMVIKSVTSYTKCQFKDKISDKCVIHYTLKEKFLASTRSLHYKVENYIINHKGTKLYLNICTGKFF